MFKRHCLPRSRLCRGTGAGTEYELIVGIPPVRRLRVVRVEPEIGTIPVQVEHVRVAVAVGYVCSAICATAREKCLCAVFYA